MRTETEDRLTRHLLGILRALDSMPPDAQVAVQQVLRHSIGLLHLLEEQLRKGKES